MSALHRIWDVATDAFDRFIANDGSVMAGSISFTCLLSLFPFLIFAATLTGILFGQTHSEDVIDALFQIAPEHVARTIEPVVVEVLSKKSGEVLTLSALFAIWVASNAVENFRLAFDRAYEVDDPRNFFQNRALAISLVFIGALVAALLGASIIFSPFLLRLAQMLSPVEIPAAAGYITYGFGVVVLVSFVFLMHRWLPGRSMRGMRLWPGVLVTAILWIIAATGFTIYLSFTPTYTVTYGTLAGVIITLMFFYITGVTIIFGAEVNAAIDRQERAANARITTRGTMGAAWPRA